MALLAFASVVLSCFLLACVILLVLDLRGERRAMRAALDVIGRRVQAHDDALALLDRAVAALAPAIIPPDARTTTAMRRPPEARGEAPPSVAVALERAVLPEPPVDMEGDRGGINPGDLIQDARTSDIERIERSLAALREDLAARPGDAAYEALLHHWEGMLDRARAQLAAAPRPATPDVANALGAATDAPMVGIAAVPALSPRTADMEAAAEKAAIRARLEAEEDERERQRDALPGLPSALDPSDDEDDEHTKVMSKPRRPTLLGGLVPTPSPRTKTLVSPGMTPPEGAPDRIETRYQELQDEARRAGLAADHCKGGDCFQGAPDVDACACTCDGCTGSRALLLQAQDEIVGPPSGPRER